jgi:hypothetical protein
MEKERLVVSTTASFVVALLLWGQATAGGVSEDSGH